MNNTYQIISIIAFVLAGLLFIVAIILFFALNVKKAIDILSGHAEKKSIMQMQNKVINKEKHPLFLYTDKSIKNTSQLVTSELAGNDGNETEILNRDNSATTVLNEDEKATEVLNDNIETTLLNNSNGYIQIIKEAMYIHTSEIL